MQHLLYARCAAAGLTLICAAMAGAAPPDRIILRGGDALSGHIVETTDSGVIFEHEVLGRLLIARDKIESINPNGPEAPPPADAATGDSAEPQAVASSEPGLDAPAAPKATWKSRFEAGFNGSEGRTERLDGRITFATERRTEETRFAFDANYRTATSRGDRTQNKFDAGAIHDWYFNDSPWLAFVQGRFEIDEFADYDQRYSLGGGVGYSFIKNDRTELVGRVGLGGSMLNGGPNDGDITPEGILKIDLTHRLTDITRVIAGAEYYPDLSRFGDYRAVLSAAIETKLAADSPASLKFGARHEFEERQAFDQDDLLEFFGLLVIEF